MTINDSSIKEAIKHFLQLLRKEMKLIITFLACRCTYIISIECLSVTLTMIENLGSNFERSTGDLLLRENFD